MSHHVIPSRVWTRLPGTDVEVYQATGHNITIYVDPHVTEITIPAEAAVAGAQLRPYVDVPPEHADDPLWADKVRAIRSLPSFKDQRSE